MAVTNNKQLVTSRTEVIMYIKNEFKEIKELVAAKPELYLNHLFAEVPKQFKDNRMYFDAPSFNSWDYNFATSRCVDFRNNKSYDVISLYAHFFTDNNQFKAMCQIKHKLGFGLRKTDPANDNSKVSKLFSDEDKQKAAVKIWDESVTANGALAETYLRVRGYDGDIPDKIRFHPKVYHSPSKSYHPAMISGVSIWPSNNVTAVLRTYLNEDGGDKAGFATNKMMLGRVKSGAVRFAPAARSLIIAEGIETALSIYQATGTATWAALSACGMEYVEVPPLSITQQITIAADNDEVGMEAANRLYSRLSESGYQIKIISPERIGTDFNDYLSAELDVDDNNDNDDECK